MAEKKSPKTDLPVSGTLGFLEKAWEWQWALKFAQAVLFLDLALVAAGHPSLLHWSLTAEGITTHLGFWIVTISAFAIYASLIAPAASSTVSILLLEIPGVCRLISFTDSEDDLRRPYNHVNLGELRDYVFDTSDQYWMEKYHEHSRNYISGFHEKRTIGNLMFGTLLLVLASLFLSNDDNQTIIHTIVIGGTEWMKALAAVFLYVLVHLMFKTWYGSQPYWIEHPPLYRQLNPPKGYARRQPG